MTNSDLWKKATIRFENGIRVYECPTMPAQGYEDVDLEKQLRMNKRVKLNALVEV